MIHRLELIGVLVIATLASLKLLVALAEEPQNLDEKLQPFQGRWRFVSGTAIHPKDPTKLVRFNADDCLAGLELKFDGVFGITYHMRQNLLREGPYRLVLDPGTNPVGCDVVVDWPVWPKHKDVWWLGSVRVDGNRLYLAFNNSAVPQRPRDFDPLKKDSLCHWLMIYERMNNPVRDALDTVEKLYRRATERKPQLPEP